MSNVMLHQKQNMPRFTDQRRRVRPQMQVRESQSGCPALVMLSASTAQDPACRSLGRVFVGAPGILSLSGHLPSERCEVKHFREYGLDRVCRLSCKELDIINEQLFDRLCNTVGACIEHSGHADKRSLGLSPPLRIQLEACDSVKSAKGSESVFLMDGGECREQDYSC